MNGARFPTTRRFVRPAQAPRDQFSRHMVPAEREPLADDGSLEHKRIAAQPQPQGWIASRKAEKLSSDLSWPRFAVIPNNDEATDDFD